MKKNPPPHGPRPLTQKKLSQEILARLRDQKMSLATAESCTGGRIAAALTAISGASDVYWGGWVTYQAQSKEKNLGVSKRQTRNARIVSLQTARAMAQGALARSRCSIALAITGWAGQTRNNDQPKHQPSGLAYLAIARRKRKTSTIQLKVASSLSRTEKQKQLTTLALLHLFKSL